MTKENKYNLKIEDMAKAGLHFGHKKESVNPNMEPYLYGLRNSVFLIDLEKTKEKLEEALDFVDKLVSEGKQ
jgi:small subunit ribosomal protein S2